MTDSGLDPAIDAGPSPAPALRTSPVPVPAQPPWTPYAVLMLSLPVIVALLIAVLKIDRTMLLAAQYAVWCVAAYAIAGLVSVHSAGAPRATSRMTQFLILFLLCFSLASFSVWLRGSRSDSSALVLQCAALVFMALPFFSLKSVARTFPVDRGLLWICHILLAFGFYSVVGDFFDIAQHEGLGGRFFGPLGDQVAWAITLPLIVYFAARRIALAALAGIALALTASRAPALTSVSALLALLVFSRGRRVEYGAMMLVLLVVGLYQAGLFSNLVTRISATEFASNDRTTTAALGFRIFHESPIFGSGYNSLGHYFPSTAHRLRIGELPAQTSTFVQMLSDGGLMTFVPYLAFVIATTVAGIKILRRSQSLNLSGAVNGLVAWLLAMLWINQSAMWFVVGSYIGPIVFGMCGLVAGLALRIGSLSAAAQAKNAPLPEARLRAAAR